MASEFTRSRSISDLVADSSQFATAAPSSELQPLVFQRLFGPVVQPQQWEPFREGIEIARIYSTTAGGPSAALLRYRPGASLERHRHAGYEHILILSGSQLDDGGEHLAGTLLVNPPGTSHAVRSIEGCVVLAIWEKPPVFETAADEASEL
ncbi:MAG: cupin domain-containing protein [Tepidisphaeraceae bacterium]|jgi:anti-sigma factor ChrR (cupin superfamily)